MYNEMYVLPVIELFCRDSIFDSIKNNFTFKIEQYGQIFMIKKIKI